MKKRYIALKKVREFIDNQPEATQEEYQQIVDQLKENGYLVEPFGKKLEKDLFEIRVRHGKSIRIFYFYHDNDVVFGVHGFVKKTQRTPLNELKTAKKIISLIKRGAYNE